MKKRILASTMASVMALSAAGTTLVSSAAVADFKTEYVTKSELRKFLDDKEIKDLVDGGIDDYGSVSGENFQKAIDFANAVLDDVDSTDDDATVAFQMVKAAKAALVHYNKAQLTALVEEYRGKYNSNNELNEDDAIYKEEDWDNFVAAFTTADDAKESDDLLETTDAYEELYKYRNPKELDKVTKTQIETARKNYIKALEMEYDYQPWQRGTVTAAKTNYDGLQFAWGALYAHIASGEQDVMEAYESFSEIKGRTVTSNPTIVAAVKAMNQAVTVLTGFSSKLDSASSKKNVTDLLAKYHGQLVYRYKADVALELANSFITAAEAATDAKGISGVAKFTVESKSTVTSGTLTSAGEFWNASFSASKEYKPLGGNGKNATANAVADDTADSGYTLASNLNGKEYTFKGKKLIGAEIVIESTAPVYYIVDKSTAGKLENNKNRIVPISGNIGVDAVWFTEVKATADAAVTSTTEVKTLNANTKFTISDLIEVSPDDILAVLATNASVDETATAFTSAMTSVNAVATAANGLASALSSLSTKLASAESAISSLTTNAGNNDVSADDITAMTSAFSTAAAALASVSVGSASSMSDLDDIDTALAAALEAVDTAVGALTANAIKQAEATLKTNVNTAKTAVTNASKTGSDYATAKTAYSRLYNNALSDALVGVTMANRNEVYDKTGEVKFKTGGTPSKTNKGIVFVPSGSGESSFDMSTPYVSDRTANNNTTVSLGVALTMYKSFVASTTDQTSAEQLDNISFLSSMDVGKNYPKAWRLLYNYMKYALADEFDASASKTYKKSDVEKLKAQAEDLLDTCVVTELFNDSTNALATNVNVASEWLKLAKADGNRNYKDNDTKYNFDYAKKGGAMNGAEDLDSTGMYNALNTTYGQLNKELSAFKYSYEDIVKKMASIAKELDGTKFDAAAKEKLTKDLQAAAEAFVKVEAVKLSAGSDLDDSELFNDDGTMNINNRLFTNGSEFDGLYCGGSIANASASTSQKIAKSKDGDNQTHYDMQVAYEKLVDDYKAATEAPVSQVVDDVDGSGKFDILDVTALLKLFVDDKMEVAKHDFNGDKAANLLDVTKLLDKFVNS